MHVDGSGRQVGFKARPALLQAVPAEGARERVAGPGGGADRRIDLAFVPPNERVPSLTRPTKTIGYPFGKPRTKQRIATQRRPISPVLDLQLRNGLGLLAQSAEDAERARGFRPHSGRALMVVAVERAVDGPLSWRRLG